MNPLHILVSTALVLSLPVAAPAGPKPRLLIELPDDCNTPDGCTLDANGDLILSIPNFNNDALVKSGLLDQPCEVQVDGNRLVVINMDWWWDCEWLTNTKVDKPFTVSVIDLE